MPEDAPGIPALLADATRSGRGLSRLSPTACAQALGLDSLTLCLRIESGLELVWYDPATIDALVFEDLQYTLGEGPTPDAARTGQPVLVPDLHTLPDTRWPALLPATRHRPPRAVHALPLHLGARRLGAVTGHRAAPGPLTPAHMAAFLTLADGALTLLTTPEGIHDMRADQPLSLHRAVVHQATGALTVQLGIPADQALSRLRAYAFTHNRPLHEVAHDVVHHHTRLDNRDTPHH
ncbi:GAF and ANTAR domain-containing protein [Streptomyces sp. NPDC004111]|uniref:GAF and ANTAR domain-containing protein n=1 Tax=Streptomyces sp. NPDC004111 TaxID=3364690 RepID=UPI0036BD593A